MSTADELLQRLRDNDPRTVLAAEPGTTGATLLDQLAGQGVRLAAVTAGGGAAPLEEVWHRAVRELVQVCVRPLDGSAPVLLEGGVYWGAWLESTATIGAEVASRFLPDVARETYLLLARRARADGLLPYKVTDAGPAYRQIQMVTPLARSVWNHHALHGGGGGSADRDFLPTMYEAMAAHDGWLARYRDTRGTGGVEAFCTFDTGHDASPRFWHVPDTTFGEDPARYDADNPLLPFVAPDLTANVACQRRYLARIATELGGDPVPWRDAAESSEQALFAQCYDATDGMFYDRDRSGAWVRVQSDVLLRVLACEIGDDDFFAAALRRYLLNTRKFFAGYPFPSVALDDPRFDHDFTKNSWGGPANFLSAIRAPHAFEHHGRFVELTWATIPVLAAVCRMTRFPQVYNPWTGEQGYTEQYSPTILWTLDAIERLSGILPRPDGQVWFSALVPPGVDHATVADAVAYARCIDGVTYEQVTTVDGAVVFRDGVPWARFPYGTRLVTDRSGTVRELIGLSARRVAGAVQWPGVSADVAVAGNERLTLDAAGRVVDRAATGLVHPTS